MPLIIAASLLVIIINCDLFAKDDDSSNHPLDLFLLKYESSFKPIENQVELGFISGIGGISVQNNSLRDDFARVYNAEFTYGFKRLYPLKVNPEIFRHSGENIGIHNLSSHLKPRSIENIGNTTDTWGLSFSVSDGFGYRLQSNSLMFTHSGRLLVSHTDIELPASNSGDQNFNNQIDDKYRFGSAFYSGLDYQISGILYASAGYENAQIYTDFSTFSWMASFLFENALQRFWDYFNPYLLYETGNNFPWINLLAKSLLSIAVYEMRAYDMFFPISSDPPLNFRKFKIGITLII